MPTVYKLLPEKQTFFSGSGTLLSGGKLYAYTAGTTTLKDTYTELDGATTNANPIVLNARGEVPNGVFGTTGAYKLVLKDASDATIWTRDNVYGEHDPANLDVSTLTSEWVASGYTPTRTGNTTFTTPGDSTAVFQVGRRLKCTDASTIYATVTAASYNVIDVLTTVTVATDSGNLSASLSRVDIGLSSVQSDALPNFTTTARFGASTAASGATNTAALTSALAAADEVWVTPGTYDNVTISASNKTLRMMAGVTFKLPNNTVTAGATSGPSVFKVTGSNVTIEGDFTVDGNRTNNDAGSFPTSVLTGSLHISGANCRINGTVTVTDAYWRGVTVENGSSTGNEVNRFHVHRLRVTNPRSYAVMLWTVKDWSIDEIEVDRSTTTGWNARVRLGTQSSSTGQCLRGRIGAVRTNGVFVTESGTQDVEIGSVQCGGGKLQESTRVRVAMWNANGALLTTDESGTGFGYLICTDCHVGSASVKAHNQSAQAAAFTQGNASCSVGTLTVDSTSSAQSDCIVGLNDGLTIGAMILRGIAAGGNGFHYDYDANAKNIVIGSIDSRGHTTTDVLVESNLGSNTPLHIGLINEEAVRTIGSGHGRDSFSWTVGTSSMVVSNSAVKATSKIIVTPKDVDAAVIMHSQGFYITQTEGSFTIFTGTGTNTANQSEWDYVVDNGV